MMSTVLWAGSADARPDCTGRCTCTLKYRRSFYWCAGNVSCKQEMNNRNLTDSSCGTFLCLMSILYFSSYTEKSVCQTHNNALSCNARHAGTMWLLYTQTHMHTHIHTHTHTHTTHKRTSMYKYTYKHRFNLLDHPIHRRVTFNHITPQAALRPVQVSLQYT